MKNFITHHLLTLFLLFGIGIGIGFGQTTIWLEDFQSYANGTGVTSTGNIGDYPISPAKWTLDVGNTNFTATTDYMKTTSSFGSLVMTGRDIDGFPNNGAGEAVWLSENITITGYTNVTLTARFRESGTMEAADFYRIEYKIDGGSWTTYATNGYQEGDYGGWDIAEQTGLSGTTLNIKVTLKCNAGVEYQNFDDVKVVGTSSSPCTTPTAQATALIFPTKTMNSIDGSFTAASPVADAYLVIRSDNNTLGANPVDGTSYSSGDDLGGDTVIQSSSSTTFSDTGLAPSTTYYYFVVAYNNTACTGGPKYKILPTMLLNNETTSADPCATAATLPFNEGFEGATFVPACWTSFRGTNGLGTNFDWVKRTSTPHHTGVAHARVSWEDVSGGNAQDWLVTPLISIPSTGLYSLKFWERQPNAIDYNSEYTIRISTNSQTTHADFTTLITYDETDFGTNYSERIIDLSAYLGQNIYIAFVMEQDNGDAWDIDDVVIEQDNDKDAEVYDTNSQPTAANIFSTVDTLGEAVSVFEMIIEDLGTTDNKATKVTNIRIKPHTTNTADWTDTIQGFKIVDGTSATIAHTATITDTYIDFAINSGAIDINDGTDLDFTFSVYLNTSNIVDNAILSFMVDADDHGFTANDAGTDFISTFFLGDFNSNDFTIDVTFDEIRFTQQPTDVIINDQMIPVVTVAATDENGNIDVDFDGAGATIGLTTTGSFDASATIQVNAVNGIATFNNLVFDTLDTAITITTTDPDTWGYSNITSSAFDVVTFFPCQEIIGAIIAFDSFEGTGNWTYATDPATYDAASHSDVWAITDNLGGNISTGSDGANFWGMRDLNNSNGGRNSYHTLSFNPIDISGATNVVLTFDYYSHGYDGTDEIRYQVIYDNGSSWTIGTALSKDTNVWTTVTINIPDTESFVRLQLKATQDGANDWAAFDNIKLTGDIIDATTWNGTAWSNGAPDSKTKAIITGDYDMNSESSFTTCGCEVKTGTTITVAANKYLKIGSEIMNNGLIEVENEGTIVQLDENATITGTNFKIHKTTTNYKEYDYTYWSSPIVDATTGDVFNANSTLSTGSTTSSDDFSPTDKIYSHTTANFSDEYGGSYPQTTGVADTFDDTGDDWGVFGGTMSPGTGYIAMGAGADFPFDAANIATGNLKQSVFFEGKINNGIITIPVTLDGFTGTNTNNKDSNLIGNPYPSAIDLAAFRTDIANVALLQGDFYFWTHDTQIATGGTGPDTYNFTNDDYATVSITAAGVVSYTSSGSGTAANQYVATGQGFFANVTGAGNLTFNNAMRVVGDNNHFLRPATNTNTQIDRFWLNLTKADMGIYRQIYIGFHDAATDTYADGDDGERMANGSNTDFYSLIPQVNKHLAIQNLATFADTKTVPLGIEIVEAGTYEITLDTPEGIFAGSQAIYLEDNLTGTTHNFANGSYSFTTVIGDAIDNRFVVVFTTNSTATVKEEILQSSLQVTNADTAINFTMLTGTNMTAIQGYDVLGKLMIDAKPTTSNFNVATKIATGTIILFKVQLENGQILNKKFVKM